MSCRVSRTLGALGLVALLGSACGAPATPTATPVPAGQATPAATSAATPAPGSTRPPAVVGTPPASGPATPVSGTPASGLAPAGTSPGGVASPQAQATVTAPEDDPAAVQDAFISNVDDLIAEASDLSNTPCADLAEVVQANPNLVPSIHGFATSLQRLGAQQDALASDDVKAALDDLNQTLGEMDGALKLCGISSP